MMMYESRLKLKIPIKLLEILEKTKALSVEYEICRYVLKYFMNEENTLSLIEKVKAKIGGYLNHQDSNSKLLFIYI